MIKIIGDPLIDNIVDFPFRVETKISYNYSANHNDFYLRVFSAEIPPKET